MNIDEIKERLKEQDGLTKSLGLEFISTPEPDTLIGRMKVDERNRQVFGFLSGGATLALAENLAGVGSMAVCPGKICVGINVSGNHVRSVLEGDTVTAYGKLVHKGRKLHVWQIDIKNNAGEIISTVQVTNYVIEPHQRHKDDTTDNDQFAE
ncbi:MAG: PaaI family thioesterase [Prevotella sp.]